MIGQRIEWKLHDEIANRFRSLFIHARDPLPGEISSLPFRGQSTALDDTLPLLSPRLGQRATTSVRPVDSIGRPMADVSVCGAHAKRLVERARAKGLAVEVRG